MLSTAVSHRRRRTRAARNPELLKIVEFWWRADALRDLERTTIDRA
jgi:hypothetical protein